jgi:ribosomal protein S18 acetylase RimI-like enzyme
MSIRYELAVPEDYDGIALVAKQAVRELGYTMPPVYRASIANSQMVAAYFDSRVVGFIQFHKRKDGIITIYKFAVDTELRGKGIGKGMLEFLEQRSRSVLHAEAIRLKVIEGTPAVDFYHAVGFNTIDKEPSKKTNLLVMRKELE